MLYDPDVVTPERMLGVVKEEGYDGAVVQRPAAPAALVELPRSVRARLDEARAAVKPLLLEFSGEG